MEFDVVQAQEYNRKASKSFWHPDTLPGAWGGRSHSVGSRAFALAVATFQSQFNLLVDGKLGPSTYGALIEHYAFGSGVSEGVVIGGIVRPFPGPVILRPGLKGSPRDVPPHQVILHVDVTWDSSGAYDILGKRGLSSHFGVDGDVGANGYSTLYQWLDPALEYGHHAGKSNRGSIGIDANTPLSMKYQKRDERKRGRSRPVVEAEVFGKKRTNLGFFPEQVKTLVALAELFEQALDIPRTWPRDEEGRVISDHLPGDSSLWRGWTGHHHHPTTHYCPGAAGVAIVDELCPQKSQ